VTSRESNERSAHLPAGTVFVVQALIACRARALPAASRHSRAPPTLGGGRVWV